MLQHKIHSAVMFVTFYFKMRYSKYSSTTTYGTTGTIHSYRNIQKKNITSARKKKQQPLYNRLKKLKINRILQLTEFMNHRMPLLHIPQCSIQNRNVHISVLNGALWDMEQGYSGIYENGLLNTSSWRLLDL